MALFMTTSDAIRFSVEFYGISAYCADSTDTFSVDVLYELSEVDDFSNCLEEIILSDIYKQYGKRLFKDFCLEFEKVTIYSESGYKRDATDLANAFQWDHYNEYLAESLNKSQF